MEKKFMRKSEITAIQALLSNAQQSVAIAHFEFKAYQPNLDFEKSLAAIERAKDLLTEASFKIGNATS